ncbi:MAG: methylenetetrahydrofolate--tRNA-(uracil(54)-C(5))-methyltransferase (FADH(2)-oxidizing) TrmFO [Clostridiales bacterium]|nr:methylenetetrahydrofolate--tRNA-(uracil(54)-C(5))-methyltransferase (FADH(2)-oxidizing) TrmFO [Clostridiales bacterium]
MKVAVIGAGLAGCEAAYQLLKRGVCVDLYEMRPKKLTPAHHGGGFAELVCSNSLRSDRIENAAGLLKEELRELDSVIMKAADLCKVPAGGALAVDRDLFSKKVKEILFSFENLNFINEEVIEIPKDIPVIIAAGPLCSEELIKNIKQLTGEDYLHFFDAAAPIVTKDSINMDIAFCASRYDRGDSDYINCPMTQEQYENFVHELLNAEVAPVHDFEGQVFEGCMPIEVMASRGVQTLAFGPCKPVGIIDPKTQKTPYACVQLRRDDAMDTLYNIVGFQTHLKFGEQKRIFSMIPGLENCEIVRYGVMHKNTFICSPKLLDHTFALKNNNLIAFAGQITGVEGYIESTASGFIAAISMFQRLNNEEIIDFTSETAIGALGHYVSSGSGRDFQPMNVNFGIISPPENKIKGGKQARYAYIAQRALNKIKDLKELI